MFRRLLALGLRAQIQVQPVRDKVLRSQTPLPPRKVIRNRRALYNGRLKGCRGRRKMVDVECCMTSLSAPSQRTPLSIMYGLGTTLQSEIANMENQQSTSCRERAYVVCATYSSGR